MSGLDNPFRATWAGITNAFLRGDPVGALREDMRLDGGAALVTGASSGLGFAIAVELARRGARVYGAARTATPELTARLRAAAGVEHIEMLPVDLADLRSIDALLDTLAARGVELELVVCNAALVPTRDHRTPQGLEQMFVVNYLSKQALIQGLLARELIPSGADRARRPRILLVSSEAHRGAKLRSPASFPDYEAFPLGEVLARYGTYKLALTVFAQDLAQRLEPAGIAVHSLCPGAVNTKVAREAPAWSKPLLRVAFRLFFQAPSKAAKPALFLCLAPELEGQSGIYLHQWVLKEPDPRACDPDIGRAHWEAAAALLQAHSDA